MTSRRNPNMQVTRIPVRSKPISVIKFPDWALTRSWLMDYWPPSYHGRGLDLVDALIDNGSPVPEIHVLPPNRVSLVFGGVMPNGRNVLVDVMLTDADILIATCRQLKQGVPLFERIDIRSKDVSGLGPFLAVMGPTGDDMEIPDLDRVKCQVDMPGLAMIYIPWDSIPDELALVQSCRDALKDNGLD